MLQSSRGLFRIRAIRFWAVNLSLTRRLPIPTVIASRMLAGPGGFTVPAVAWLASQARMFPDWRGPGGPARPLTDGSLAARFWRRNGMSPKRLRKGLPAGSSETGDVQPALGHGAASSRGPRWPPGLRKEPEGRTLARAPAPFRVALRVTLDAVHGRQAFRGAWVSRRRIGAPRRSRLIGDRAACDPVRCHAAFLFRQHGSHPVPAEPADRPPGTPRQAVPCPFTSRFQYVRHFVKCACELRTD